MAKLTVKQLQEIWNDSTKLPRNVKLEAELKRYLVKQKNIKTEKKNGSLN